MQIILILGLVSALLFLKSYFPKYIEEKGRNLVRRELGYGSDLELNREKAWFGKVGFEPKEEKAS